MSAMAADWWAPLMSRWNGRTLESGWVSKHERTKARRATSKWWNVCAGEGLTTTFFSSDGRADKHFASTYSVRQHDLTPFSLISWVIPMWSQWLKSLNFDRVNLETLFNFDSESQISTRNSLDFMQSLDKCQLSESIALFRLESSEIHYWIQITSLSTLAALLRCVFAVCWAWSLKL